MPDDTDLANLEAAMRSAAKAILAGFDAERVAPGVALGIIGMVVVRLLEHAPHYRNEFIACLQDHDPSAAACNADAC